MLHSVVSTCLFSNIAMWEREGDTIVPYTIMTLIVSNGKGFNYVLRHTGPLTQNYFLKIVTVYYGWEKMLGVSHGSEVFQNGERKSQTFRLRLKHRAANQTCTGVSKDTKITPINCVKPFCWMSKP